MRTEALPLEVLEQAIQTDSERNSRESYASL